MSIEVEVTGIAAGGAGVGRLPDGRVTFVHRTAPGDRVEVRVVEGRKRWTRSELVSVRTPSPDRREAPCPYYERCGGCTLEHLTYPAQLRAKSRIVQDALRRIGGLDAALPETTPSPRETRYRSRVTFTLRREPAGVVAGFHELEQADRVMDMTGACLLPEEAVAEAWDALRAGWGGNASRLPSGPELRLTLRATAQGDVSLAVDGGYAPGRPDELVDAIPALRSVWHRSERARGFTLLAGDPVLEERWGADTVQLAGDVFTQVNREAAALLEAHVLERVAAADPASVLDAYCGVGLYARRLAGEGVRVVGIEANGAAAAEARRAAPHATILDGTVEARLEEALPVDLAILNPPRAGLHRRVTELLRRQAPTRLLYVSCDPATLARDLKRLEGSYRVAGVRCYDMFPQTAHVETVVELESCATT
ncbi:MAG TPA: TRAM domain-containing protein [Longimicrobiales bacterium]|nr:TRAM domain-containing protein [Longimicrobiales bacterium]